MVFITRELSLSKLHNCKVKIEDLGGILALWKLEKLVYGWLRRATIRFCISCASSCLPSVIPGM